MHYDVCWCMPAHWCAMLHSCLCVRVCSSLICECMLEVSMFPLVDVYELVNSSLVVYM